MQGRELRSCKTGNLFPSRAQAEQWTCCKSRHGLHRPRRCTDGVKAGAPLSFFPTDRTMGIASKQACTHGALCSSARTSTVS